MVVASNSSASPEVVPKASSTITSGSGCSRMVMALSSSESGFDLNMSSLLLLDLFKLFIPLAFN